MEIQQDVYRFEVERLEMKLAYLQLLNSTTDDLLKYLNQIPSGSMRIIRPFCGSRALRHTRWVNLILNP